MKTNKLLVYQLNTCKHNFTHIYTVKNVHLTAGFFNFAFTLNTNMILGLSNYRDSTCYRDSLGLFTIVVVDCLTI